METGISTHKHLAKSHILVDIDFSEGVDLRTTQNTTINMLPHFVVDLFHETEAMSDDVEEKCARRVFF